MGGVYRFYCRKCKFEFSSEGKEGCMGDFYRGKCMKCNTCGKIGDVQTHSLWDTPDWVEVPIECSCGSTDLINYDFKCPKCETNMSREREPYIMED